MLTTPLSFVASSNCVLYVGARPRFADVDADTYNLDAAAAITAGAADGVKACIPVSLTGLPADLEPLQTLREQGVLVIEDACHALGARRNGRPVGGDGLADMYVFSTHPVKAITTGEGGVVVTEDDDLADCLRVFRTHGIRRGGGEGRARGRLALRRREPGLQLSHHRFSVRARPVSATSPRGVRRPAQ